MVTAPPRSDTTRRLLGLYLPTLAISIGQGLVLPAVPALAARFSVPPAFAAQIVTAYAAGRLLALVPSGMLVDRFGAALVLPLASLVIVAGALLMLLTPAFAGLLVGQMLVGAGSSLWIAGREIAGLALVRAEQRGRLMSGFFGFQLAGMALGPVAGGLLVDGPGLTALLVVNLLVAAAVAAQTIFVERPYLYSPAPDDPLRTAPATTISPASLWLGLREIAPAFRATFSILVFATFSMHVFRYSLNSLLPLYAGVTRGLSATQVGALFGLSSIWITIMILPAGFILDRVGRKWASVPAAAIPAVSFALMPFADSMFELGVLASVLGISNGLSLGSMSTFSYDVVPAHARGRLQAARRLIGELGSLTGPLAGGLIADRFGAGAAFLAYVPLMVLTTVLLAVGTRETLARRGAVLESVG